MDQEQKIIFRRFLEEYPWPLLKKFINESSKLKKDIGRGGVRIIKKNMQLILSGLEKKGIEDTGFQESLFINWFNDSLYGELLFDFFQSAEHEALLEKRNIQGNHYVLNDHYFKEFVDLLSSSHVDFFVHLSPMVFTDEQLNAIESNINNIENHRDPKKDNEDNKETNENLIKQNTLAKKQIKFLKKEIKKQDQKLCMLEKNYQKLNEKANVWRSSDAKLKAELAQIKGNFDREIVSLTEEKRNVEADLSNSLQENETLRTKSENDRRRIKNLENQLAVLKDKKERPFQDIITKIDYDEIVSEINAPDDVRELLETIIRPLKKDESQDKQEIGQNPLTTFWSDLQEKEKKIIHRVFDIEATSIVYGHIDADWPDFVDYFTDLKCSLSTRLFLIDIISTIIRQYVIKRIEPE
jgi:predicted  nucleic acid-binding Zn-ribbon protein